MFPSGSSTMFEHTRKLMEAVVKAIAPYWVLAVKLPISQTRLLVAPTVSASNCMN